jgi:hypothetical protein
MVILPQFRKELSIWQAEKGSCNWLQLHGLWKRAFRMRDEAMGPHSTVSEAPYTGLPAKIVVI